MSYRFVLPGALCIVASAFVFGLAPVSAQNTTPPDAKQAEKLDKEKQEKERRARDGRQYGALQELYAALSAPEPKAPAVMEIDPALLEKNRAIIRKGVDGVMVCEGSTDGIRRKSEVKDVDATLSWGYWTGRDKKKLPVMHNYIIHVKAIDTGSKVKVTELTVTENTKEFLEKIAIQRQQVQKDLETKTGERKIYAAMMLVDLDRYIGDLAQAEKDFAQLAKLVNDPKMVEEIENSLVSPIKISRLKHKMFVDAVDAYELAQAGKK